MIFLPNCTSRCSLTCKNIGPAEDWQGLACSDAHELGDLVADFLGVIGDGLDGVDLILHRPQALLDLPSLLGKTVHLAVDGANRLSGQAGAREGLWHRAGIWWC